MTDKEIFKVWRDEDQGIGIAKVVGELDEASAVQLKIEIQRIMSNVTGKTNWLIIPSRLKQILSHNVRKYLIELSSDTRINKIAFIANSKIMQTIVDFVMAAARRQHRSRFFTLEVDAVKWLNNGD